MNKYEQRAAEQRRIALRNSSTLWTAGTALILVILLILGIGHSAPSSFFTRAAVAGAIVLLVLRQIARRLKGRPSRAAEPDPQSRLNLD
ncbi:MAG TPA: hypothetical protein VKX25_19240 [Bryobacteraceae bacterium]|jgi:uncharacterized integral membrane protein|nr:hypothetical protein [Bryobacteraceae bacterium]